MELAELLQWLSGAQKTGTLVVERGKISKKVAFKEGRILSSSSTDAKEYLGAFLVSHGFVTDAELGKAISAQLVQKTLLGRILIDAGAISETDLQQMLRLKAEETIYDIFGWTEGEFRFLDGELPAPETIVPISVDVAAIVLEGMQRIDESRRIREAIPTLEAVAVAVGSFDESELGEMDGHVLAMVDDDRTIAELCTTSHASEFHVCKALLRQMQVGRIKLVRPRGAAISASAIVPEAPPAPPAISGELLMTEARQQLAKGELGSALRHSRAARALEPENRKLEAGIGQIEDSVRRELEKSPLKPNDFPILARTLDELAKFKLSAQEGFVLTRLEGTHDLASLYKMGPLPRLDMQLLFAKLVKDGHVRMQSKR